MNNRGALTAKKGQLFNYEGVIELHNSNPYERSKKKPQSRERRTENVQL